MLLITGSTGFIGKNLIPILIQYDRVKLLVRRTSNIRLFKGIDKIEFVYGDIVKNEGLERALSNVKAVIHGAARTIGRNYIEYYKTNTLGTVHLIKAMKKVNVERILYLSTHAACGPCSMEKPSNETDIPKPISSYGRTKKIAEEHIIRSGLHYTILRPVAVYGPHDTEILKYIKLLNRGICPIVGWREKYLNLIYISDLVQLIVKIVRKNQYRNRTYFVNDGNCYSQRDVLNEISNILGRASLKTYVPESIAMFFALLNDTFLPQQKRMIWRDKVRELARSHWLCSSEQLINELNFTPKYNLKQGMKETINWYRKNDFLD